jgi:hypothetical protein
MRNGVHSSIGSRGQFRSRDWDAVVDRLKGILNVLTELRRQFGTVEGAQNTQPALTTAVHDAFVDYNLNNLSRLQDITLRPIAPEAKWVDMPTGKSFLVGQSIKRRDDQYWLIAFPDYQEVVTNVVGNEEYVVIERHAVGTHKGRLLLDNQWLEPTGRMFEIDSADVIQIEAGFVVGIDHYYDLVSVLRQLGLLPNIPLGHDERDATPLPVLHASGFLRRSPDLRTFGRWPAAIGQRVSISSSQSQQAKMNMANCLAIHEAFIEHTPERFSELIAENSIWIDVPTGEVLNGAAAAAHHDHGNWQTAFPDSSAEVVNLIGNNDWVCVQHRGFGNHLGVLRLGGQDYKPTGRKVEIRVLDMVQYSAGKAVLIRNYYDMAMMLLQLGIIPQ